MKKKGIVYAVLGIVFVLFNVIAFAVPTEKTATFWIAYGFTAIAFLLQIGIWQFAFKEEVLNDFYNEKNTEKEAVYHGENRFPIHCLYPSDPP